MKKKIILSVFIIAFLILFVIPVRISKTFDGGSTVYSPLVWWYAIRDLNEVHYEEPLLSHNDPDYHPVKTYYVKGTRIVVFRQVLYGDNYEVQ